MSTIFYSTGALSVDTGPFSSKTTGVLPNKRAQEIWFSTLCNGIFAYILDALRILDFYRYKVYSTRENIIFQNIQINIQRRGSEYMYAIILFVLSRGFNVPWRLFFIMAQNFFFQEITFESTHACDKEALAICWWTLSLTITYILLFIQNFLNSKKTIFPYLLQLNVCIVVQSLKF